MVALFTSTFGYFAMLPMTDDPPDVALSGRVRMLILLSFIPIPFSTIRSLSK